MKKLFTFSAITILTFTVIAQPPQLMSYQSVVRTAGGELITTQSIGVRTTILRGSIVQIIVYQETYSPNPSTNENGLLTLAVGSGIPSTGDFSKIDWSNGPYFLRTEMDPKGGTNYSISGQSQILSVPYTLYSKYVENNNDADADASNEIQAISLSGTNLTLNKGGGTVVIPGDNWGSQIAATDVTLAGNGTTASPLKIAQQSATGGQVLKWKGSTWAPDNDLGSLWTKSGNNIYYTTGWVSIGTTSHTLPLSIANTASNSCYIGLSEPSGSEGMRIGSYLGSMAFQNDNINKNIFFRVRHESGWDERLTILGSNGNIGIGDITPDASLDVEGTVKVGVNGKSFSELTELTGTTGGLSTYYVPVAYPSGYTRVNTRVLSVEINASGDVWVGQGFNNNDVTKIPVSYNLSTTEIYVFYPNATQFQSKPFRVLLMKVE